MTICSVPGCIRPASGRFGSMCEKHRQRQRRHGDANQDSIRASQVKPYVERVQKLVERDRSGKIAAGLEKLVGIVRDYCEGIVSDYDHGRPMNKHQVQAAREVLTVFRDFSPVQCASVVAGMHLFMDAEPRAISSDKGFRFELVRQFRGISDANIGMYENPDSGEVKRAYKEIPPRTVDQLGQMLLDGFKTFVAFVRMYERKQAEREQEARNLLEQGFSSLSDNRE